MPLPKDDLALIQSVEPGADQQKSTLYDETTKSLEDDRLKAEITNLVQDREQRKVYGNRLFWLVVIWLSVVGIILIAQGVCIIPFKLSVTVATTMIGSTTVSVLGLFAIVANYLFPKK